MDDRMTSRQLVRACAALRGRLTLTVVLCLIIVARHAAGGLGTPRLVRDIFPGADPQAKSEPADFAQLGARVLFTADDGAHGREVWVTDGTPGGTSLLKDINP